RRPALAAVPRCTHLRRVRFRRGGVVCLVRSVRPGQPAQGPARQDQRRSAKGHEAAGVPEEPGRYRLGIRRLLAGTIPGLRQERGPEMCRSGQGQRRDHRLAPPRRRKKQLVERLFFAPRAAACRWYDEGVAHPHAPLETIMRKLGLTLIAALALLLSGCGYNTFQTTDEQVKAAWSEVLNQYQRRADLIPNLVNTVKAYAQHEKEVLTTVTEARAKVGSIQATPELINDPGAFDKFQA